jgi:hypothetical protein
MTRLSLVRSAVPFDSESYQNLISGSRAQGFDGRPDRLSDVVSEATTVENAINRSMTTYADRSYAPREDPTHVREKHATTPGPSAAVLRRPKQKLDRETVLCPRPFAPTLP